MKIGRQIGGNIGHLLGWVGSNLPFKDDLDLYFKSRSGLDLPEIGSGLSLNAKIMPSVALCDANNYLYRYESNFQSGDASGFVEIRFYNADNAKSALLFSTCSESATQRYFIIKIALGKITVDIRSNVGTIFRNRFFCNNATTVGWHKARITSSGGSYIITIDDVNQAIAFGDGVNDGRWIDLVTLRHNVAIGCSKDSGGFAVGNMECYIDYVNYNNSHTWRTTGAGNFEYDGVGSSHMTWQGTGTHINYNISNPVYCMDIGYSRWVKTDVLDEYVPYKENGSPNDVASYLSGYLKLYDSPGNSTLYNLAPAIIDFDYGNTGNSLLAVFKKDNITIFIDTGGMKYYNASEVYRWRQDELADPRIYSDEYKNVGYKGISMAKVTIIDDDIIYLREYLTYGSDKTLADEYKVAKYCRLTPLIVMSGGEPVYDPDDYLTWI